MTVTLNDPTLAARCKLSDIGVATPISTQITEAYQCIDVEPTGSCLLKTLVLHSPISPERFLEHYTPR
jgi:hypothetical protein